MDKMNDSSSKEAMEIWPSLPLEAWKDTYETLHMWMQIVGKVKLELCPFLNQWWEVAFYVTARGMTTGSIPSNNGIFEVDFDFIEHNLLILTSDGITKAMPLIPCSVADFYQEFMMILRSAGIEVNINTKPDEVENPIPFEQDHVHAAYDPEYVNRFWRILVQVDTVLKKYRSPFTGKSSPIHFFWGSCDLAETRFSGREAPERQGADRITRIAYSQEEISCGFWPGNDKIKEPAFYSYTYPEPPGLKTASIHPDAAFYDADLGEFLLKYEDVRSAASPEQMLLDFFQSTYEAGATLAQWNRDRLEQKMP